MRYCIPRNRAKIIAMLKAVDARSHCPELCTVCNEPCIGAAPNFLWVHTCPDLHQWVTPPDNGRDFLPRHWTPLG
jgi:hypothetical protein